jgi:pimeloyl-ACP methyl ester carboxylesterase
VVRVLKAEQGSVCFFGPARGDFAEGAVRLEVVPDTTHFLPMERPDLVQSALRNGCTHS